MLRIRPLGAGKTTVPVTGNENGFSLESLLLKLMLPLLVPGVVSEGHTGSLATTLVGSEELRQAGEGRLSQRSGFRAGEMDRQALAASAELVAEAERAEEAARLAAEETPQAGGDDTASAGPAGNGDRP